MTLTFGGWAASKTYRIPRVAVEHTIVIRATIGSIGMNSHVGHHSDRNCFDGMSNCHCVWAQFGWQVEICDSASCNLLTTRTHLVMKLSRCNVVAHNIRPYLFPAQLDDTYLTIQWPHNLGYNRFCNLLRIPSRIPS